MDVLYSAIRIVPRSLDESMKLRVTIRTDSQAAEFDIDLPAQTAGERCHGPVQFVLNGEPGEINWAEVEPGVYSFLEGSKSVVAGVRPMTDVPSASPALPGGARFEITVSGRAIKAEIRNSRDSAGSASAGVHEADAGIVASMPGRIAKVLVTENSDVSKGDGLLVIEAMKMQNEIRSPRAGRVAKIHVRQGEGVETGAKLITLS
ncbi:MAG: biotin/lipoyl-binding protein [Acidobacteriota bacterium]|nr:biotin/lipoyl-binding protein [Acidobacteriota bacterium]